MDSFSVYNPDEEEKRIKKYTREELEKLETCPTCDQIIEKKVNLDELRKVVTVYKMCCGYDKDDKAWDRAFFKVYIPTAKKMIEFLGNWKDAADCIQDTVTSIKDWNPAAHITLQKIFTNHMAEWKKNKQEKGHYGV